LTGRSLPCQRAVEAARPGRSGGTPDQTVAGLSPALCSAGTTAWTGARFRVT
jgi:hypothetical protein